MVVQLHYNDGFDSDTENKKYITIRKYFIVILPSFDWIPFETRELPQIVINQLFLNLRLNFDYN